MRELVLETITEQADIEIVAEIQNEDDIVQVVDGTRPDFLIIALDESDQRPSVCDTLLRRHPAMKILALASGRNISMFFWASLDIHTTSIETSQAGILCSLRGKSKGAGV